MSGNPYSSPTQNAGTSLPHSRRTKSSVATAALLCGILLLAFAAFMRLSNAGWLVIACFILYVIVSVFHLTTIGLAWKWDRRLGTSMLSLTASVLLFLAFFVQYDYGDGPSFISGLAFFDSDVESRNSMPSPFRWASLTTNYLVFIPNLLLDAATLMRAWRNRSRAVA